MITSIGPRFHYCLRTSSPPQLQQPHQQLRQQPPQQQLQLPQQPWQQLIVMMATMVVALITAIVTQTDVSVQSVGKLDEIKKCADQMEIIRISDVDRAIYQSVSLYASSIDC